MRTSVEQKPFIRSRIYDGFVEHKRHLPALHSFRYPLFFFCFDLDELAGLDRGIPFFGYNRFRPFSIHDGDYLDPGALDLRTKVLRRLAEEFSACDIARILLVTSARYFNHVFNPVSFYYVLSAREELLCILAEVNNTFGEKHLYVLRDGNGPVRTYPARFRAQKSFHVSPFNNLEGEYSFRFSSLGDQLDISIELWREGERVFEGRLQGKALELTTGNIARMFLRHPLAPQLTLPRIFFEAARLYFLRSLPYHEKPMPHSRMTIRRKGPTLCERLSMRLFFRLLKGIETGGLQVRLPDGRGRYFGNQGEPIQGEMILHEDRFFKKAVLGGDVGLGEAYVDGLWDSDDIVALFSVLIRNRRTLFNGYPVTAFLSRLKNRVLHALRANDSRGSRKNIEAHYDLGNEFFQTFLDRNLIYSSGIYRDGTESCEEAQQRKIELILQKAQIEASDSVLEIGCGWGGFAAEAARKTGCRVTGITVSEKQFAYAREWMTRERLEDRVSIRLVDYRDMTGTFDKIVSIEILEAVGPQYLKVFFSTCDRLLKPGGRAVFQVITVPDQNYDDYRRETDWIQKHIFPGGHLLSVSVLANTAARHSSLVMEHLEDIGPHYAATLRDWRENFLKNRQNVRSLGFDEAFVRKWSYYLSICEAGFRERALGDVQVVFRKPA
ncbi:MAG: Cyclopropane-fatty-acyl-phospholipid synthase [Syntrophus sp. PtaU1.Bin208]|nr:MAG: Cyclopropane-fatty-acyl-phospholipid synthase [Syntrophus sp. PtaU1.Bin208]